MLAFTWRKDSHGYDLSGDGQLITRRGGPLVAYDPAAFEPPLHFVFGSLRKQILHPGEAAPAESDFMPFARRRFNSEPQALLAFVNEYGFLGSTEWGADGRAGTEPVDYLVRQCAALSAFFDFATINPKTIQGIFSQHAPSMGLRLAHTRGEYRIYLEPSTLLAWMWMRVATDAVGGLRWRGDPCLYCMTPMPRGPGGYRPQARFCSDKCRVYFNRADKQEQRKRSKAALAKGKGKP